VEQLAADIDERNRQQVGYDQGEAPAPTEGATVAV
jgi:hypothetical protein